jgi:mevalonate kinase
LRRGIAVAPGKVIISGEHFVVHGATAVAAAIQERSVRVEASRSDAPAVRVVDDYPLAAPENEEQLTPVRRVVQSLYESRGAEAQRVSISISSTLGRGSGLGSSAATMVAAAGAVCALEGWTVDSETLTKAANEGERLVHGNPSGVDVTVSARGGIILFRKGAETRFIEPPRPMTILVAYSGMKRSTRKLIARVAALRDVYPHLFAGLCQSSTLVSELCAEAMVRGDVKALGALMTYGHAVLSRAGASNERLDELVDLCLSLGCLGAKLTGAGGGGSIVAIPPPEAGRARSIRDALASKGYDAFLAGIPAGGARAWTEG